MKGTKIIIGASILFLGIILFLKFQSTKKAPINPAVKQSVISSTPTNSLTHYVACSCGCCGGIEPKKQCLYKVKGDSLEKIIREDEQVKQNGQCATMGCSMGIDYIYCD